MSSKWEKWNLWDEIVITGRIDGLSWKISLRSEKTRFVLL